MSEIEAGLCRCGCRKPVKRTWARGHNALRHGGKRIGAAWPEYAVWTQIKDRCLNPNNRAYRRYGGRGLRVCDRWRDSFEAFIADVGRRPTGDHSIERVDNDDGYHPLNCKWATRAEQARNRSNLIPSAKRAWVISEYSRLPRTGKKVKSGELAKFSRRCGLSVSHIIQLHLKEARRAENV